MKPQSRAMSMIESWTNIVVGIGIQAGANAIFIPLLFGATMKASPLFWLVAIMTVLSNVRSYVLRRLFESIRMRGTPPDFQHIVEEIAAERMRQIVAEGFSLAHDDEHCDGELALAAAAYAFTAALDRQSRQIFVEPIAAEDCDKAPWPRCILYDLWPDLWSFHWFKPTHPRRDLIKAAALIIAEIGRLDRATAKRNTR